MAITSPNVFWDLLEKSGLLSAARLNELRPSLADESDPKAIAKRLLRDGVLTRWQVIQLLSGRTGLTFGKYKLMDQLQADQTGRVFLAEHLQLGRQVILKTLSRSYAASHPEILRQFLGDAQNLAGLDHRNIVHVFDVDSHEDRYFLVMEYAAGSNLQELVEAGGPMSYDRIARYISQAAAGLAYAHQRKLIHGDVRPANFVVDAQDNVKILNLGVRRLLDEDASQEVLAESGPAELVDYLAPEQEPDGPATDPRSDLYSLGAVMYFLFTAHPPFPEGTEEDRRRQHATATPPAIQRLRADAPTVLVEICGRLMAKDPADRIQSAAELAIALDTWLAFGHASGTAAGTAATAAPTDPQAFWEVAQQAALPAESTTWVPELPPPSPAAPAAGEFDFLSGAAPGTVAETATPDAQPWEGVPQAAPATTDSGGFFDFLGDEEPGPRRRTPPPRKTSAPRKPAAPALEPEVDLGTGAGQLPTPAAAAAPAGSDGALDFLSGVEREPIRKSGSPAAAKAPPSRKPADRPAATQPKAPAARPILVETVETAPPAASSPVAEEESLAEVEPAQPSPEDEPWAAMPAAAAPAPGGALDFLADVGPEPARKSPAPAVGKPAAAKKVPDGSPAAKRPAGQKSVASPAASKAPAARPIPVPPDHDAKPKPTEAKSPAAIPSAEPQPDPTTAPSFEDEPWAAMPQAAHGVDVGGALDFLSDVGPEPVRKSAAPAAAEPVSASGGRQPPDTTVQPTQASAAAKSPPAKKAVAPTAKPTSAKPVAAKPSAAPQATPAPQATSPSVEDEPWAAMPQSAPHADSGGALDFLSDFGAEPVRKPTAPAAVEPVSASGGRQPPDTTVQPTQPPAAAKSPPAKKAVAPTAKPTAAKPVAAKPSAEPQATPAVQAATPSVEDEPWAAMPQSAPHADSGGALDFLSDMGPQPARKPATVSAARTPPAPKAADDSTGPQEPTAPAKPKPKTTQPATAKPVPAKPVTAAPASGGRQPRDSTSTPSAKATTSAPASGGRQPPDSTAKPAAKPRMATSPPEESVPEAVSGAGDMSWFAPAAEASDHSGFGAFDFASPADLKPSRKAGKAAARPATTNKPSVKSAESAELAPAADSPPAPAPEVEDRAVAAVPSPGDAIASGGPASSEDLRSQRKRDKGATPTSASGGAATEQGVAPANAGGVRIQLSRKTLIIGGAVLGAGLLLTVVGVIIGAVLFFFRPAKEIANRDAGQPAVEEQTATSGDGTEGDGTKPGGADQPTTAERPPDEASSEKTPGKTGAEPADPGDKKTTDPDDGAMEKPAGKPEGPDQPQTTPEEPQPKQPEESKPEPPQPTPPEEPKPAPQPTPKPEEKPAPPPPEKKPAPPAKKPFEDFPAFVSLPVPESTEEKSLGRVHTTEENRCLVSLQGGETILRRQAFVLREASDTSWEFLLRTGDSGPEGKIATLNLKDGNLVFQWQPEAKSQPSCAQLHNCALMLRTADDPPKLVTLREPVRGDPLNVDLEKPLEKGEWKLEGTPEPSLIKVEILAPKGLKCKVDWGKSSSGERGTAWVQFEDTGDFVNLKVDTSLKRAGQNAVFQVTAKPYFKVEPEGEPKTLVKGKKLKQIAEGYTMFEAQMPDRIKQAKGSKLPPEQKAALEKQMEMQHDFLKSRVAQCQKLEQILGSSGGKLPLHVRLYVRADEGEIDLLKAGF